MSLQARMHCGSWACPILLCRLLLHPLRYSTSFERAFLMFCFLWAWDWTWWPHRLLPAPSSLWSCQKLFSHSHLDEFFSILLFMNCQPFYVVCILPSDGNCNLTKTICVSVQCGIAACVVYVFIRGKQANWSVAFLFLITFLFPSQASLFYILTCVPPEGEFNRSMKWTGMFKNKPKFCNEIRSERTQLLKEFFL